MFAAEKLLRTVFAQELARKVPDELMEFFDEFPQLYGSDMIALYNRYYTMLTRIVERGGGDEEPKSIWFKAWDAIKNFFSKLRIVIMLLLLAVAIVYMVLTINTSGSSKKAAPSIDSIGTVTIDKGR